MLHQNRYGGMVQVAPTELYVRIVVGTQLDMFIEQKNLTMTSRRYRHEVLAVVGILGYVSVERK